MTEHNKKYKITHSSIHFDNILSTRNNNDNNEIQYNHHFDNLDTIDNFILIIDFNNLGGGTTFFLNCIVSKYKNNVNFVIARNNGNDVVFNINEEILIKRKFNVERQIMFLEKNKNKIMKIFVNSTIGHNTHFIEHLFKLDKEVTTISHDYSLLFENFQPFYYEIKRHINKKEPMITNKVDVNKYNKIILQNEELIHLYKEFISDEKKICINPLPDFNFSHEKILTNNNKIVVGIIGNISKKKGLKNIENMINYSKENIEFVIFGTTQNNVLSNISHPYNTINELNSLLKEFKPNVFLEMSIWPETYSYTLSLMMLTQLPIIYFKKDFPSVLHNRLSQYKNAHSFNYKDDIFNLIESTKQDFLYTIDPVVYFPPFWDEYFLLKKEETIQEKKNLVIILSKIFVSEKPFSYTEKRSIYTPTERYLQTLEGINSIKKYIEKPYIILFDNSNFENNENIYNDLKTNVDEFINVTHNTELNYYTNECEYKAFGEISQFLELYRLRLRKFDYTNVMNIFKISGRYLVNETFDKNFYMNNNNICKINKNVTERVYWYTSFYKLTTKYLDTFYNKLSHCFDKKNNYENLDLETIFSKLFKNDFHFVTCLGITQNISAWDEKTKI